jgi:hypothetical protein
MVGGSGLGNQGEQGNCKSSYSVSSPPSPTIKPNQSLLGKFGGDTVPCWRHR